MHYFTEKTDPKHIANKKITKCELFLNSNKYYIDCTK